MQELEDMKAKHGQATKGQKGAEMKLNDAQSARNVIDAQMAAIGDKVLRECHSIKAICSNFNLVRCFESLRFQIQGWLDPVSSYAAP